MIFVSFTCYQVSFASSETTGGYRHRQRFYDGRSTRQKYGRHVNHAVITLSLYLLDIRDI